MIICKIIPTRKHHAMKMFRTHLNMDAGKWQFNVPDYFIKRKNFRYPVVGTTAGLGALKNVKISRAYQKMDDCLVVQPSACSLHQVFYLG